MGKDARDANSCFFKRTSNRNEGLHVFGQVYELAVRLSSAQHRSVRAGGRIHQDCRFATLVKPRIGAR